MWLLRWDRAKQWSLCLVCRDITFGTLSLCVKLQLSRSCHTVRKLRSHAKVICTCPGHWPLLSQAFPGHQQHRCQTGESRCWQKILRPSCEAIPNVHVSPVEATDIRSRIYQLNRRFFDATMFLDDLLCGKRNWVNFLLLISPYTVMTTSYIRKSPLSKEQLWLMIKSKGSWDSIRRTLNQNVHPTGPQSVKSEKHSGVYCWEIIMSFLRKSEK